MISLVTQSDGSARRVPWVALALAGAIAFGFADTYGEMKAAQAEADVVLNEAMQIFRENPHLAVPDEFEVVLPAASVRRIRDEYDAEREELGIHGAVPEFIIGRSQARFDAKLEVALEMREALPIARYGFQSSEGEPALYYQHAFFHASLAAFVIALVGVLLVGIPLEDAWGSVAFGLFAAAAIPLGAALSQAVPPIALNPWLGAGGLVAALLGASSWRWFTSGSPRLLGGIPLAAWWVVPGWLALEFVVARGATAETWQMLPVAAHGAMFAFGFVTAAGLRMVGVEESLVARWSDSEADLRNPVFEEAMELREKGKREEALKLLEQGFQAKPDRDLALGVWDVARDVGQAERGVGAALWVANDAIKRGQSKAATEQWIELVEWAPEFVADPTFLLRMSDSLIREDARDAAIDAIRRTVSGPDPLAGTLALRAVKMAGGLDRTLAREVAEKALESALLSDADRSKLEAQLRKLPATAEAPDQAVGEHRSRTGETTEQLPATRAKLESFGELRAAPSESVDLPPADEASGATEPDEDGPDLSTLDPGALDLSALGGDPEPAVEGAAGESVDFSSDDASVLDPNAFDASALGADVGEAEAVAAEDPESWNSPGMISDLGAEETSAAVAAVPGEEPDAEFEEEVDADVHADIDEIEDFDLADLRRTLQVVGTVPLALGQDVIEIDTEGRGKSTLHFDRIEALAVGAVRGLAPKAVVVVDLIVNWVGSPDEPLRVLRIRSDHFDPRRVVPGAANGVAALRQMITTIADYSRATCLPDAEAVRGGRFVVFDDLEAYEREALQAER